MSIFSGLRCGSRRYCLVKPYVEVNWRNILHIYFLNKSRTEPGLANSSNDLLLGEISEIRTIRAHFKPEMVYQQFKCLRSGEEK